MSDSAMELRGDMDPRDPSPSERGYIAPEDLQAMRPSDDGGAEIAWIEQQQAASEQRCEMEKQEKERQERMIWEQERRERIEQRHSQRSDTRLDNCAVTSPDELAADNRRFFRMEVGLTSILGGASNNELNVPPDIEMDESNRNWYSPATNRIGDIMDLVEFVYGDRSEGFIQEINEEYAAASADELKQVHPREAKAWSKPQAFPESALPPTLLNFCKAISKLHGSPIEFIAAPALATTGACLGKGIYLPTGQNLRVFGAIYLLLGAASGWGKSVNLKPIFAAINEFELELREKHKLNAKALNKELKELEGAIASAEKHRVTTSEEKERHAAELASLTAQRAAVEACLIAPTLVIEDTTPEKMVVLLAQNRGVLASLSSDARQILTVLFGRYSGTTEEQWLLKAFSNEPIRQSRISREETFIPESALAVVWATQQDMVRKMFETANLTESGLMSRFLVCQMEKLTEPVECATAVEEAAYSSRSRQLLSTFHQRSGPPLEVAITSEARRILSNYQSRIRRQVIDGELNEITPFALRWGELAWRLALILHCFDSGVAAAETVLSANTATSAVRLMWWFSRHQRCLLQAKDTNTLNKQLAQAKTYVDSKPAGVTPRELYRHAESLYGSSQAAKDVLWQLYEEGSIDIDEGSRTCRFRRRPDPNRRR